MKRDKESKKEKVAVNKAERIRIVAVVLCALLGAFLLGSAANEVLVWISWAVSKVFNIEKPSSAQNYPISVAAYALLGGIFGAFFCNLVFDFFENVIQRWDKMDSGDKITYFLGSVTGMIASLPFFILLNSLVSNAAAAIAFVFMIFGFSALTIYLLRSMDDTLPWQRSSKPGRKRSIKILDTNIFIDGRIYEITRCGFIEGTLYVPQFVLDELQYLADHGDSMRRQRGRRGLDVLRHLKSEFAVEVGNYDKLAPDLGEPVDKRLVRLARHLGGDIVTNDFNLNRVAELQEVRVLNINDLALALRTNILPQEHFQIHVVKEVSQSGQGVGYLEDGTMVIIEHGRDSIGETVTVMVTQVHQTERGKLIFAEVDPEAEGANKKNSTRRP